MSTIYGMSTAPMNTPLATATGSAQITGAASLPLVMTGVTPSGNQPLPNGAGASGSGWTAKAGQSGWSAGNPEPNQITLDISGNSKWWLVGLLGLFAIKIFLDGR